MTAATVDAEATRLAGPLHVALGRLARRLRPHAEDGLTGAQLSALSTIDRTGPLTLGEIAAREGIGPPATSRLVGSLEAAGLVAGTRDPADRRSRLITITAAGERLLAGARARRTEFLADRIARLSPDERGRLAAAIPAIESLLDERTS